MDSKVNAKVSNITFGDVDDGINNQDMVAIEHEILVESEKDTITDFFNLLGISPIRVHGKPFRSRKSLGKRKINCAMEAITEKVIKILNNTIVGNEYAAKEIHDKAAHLLHYELNKEKSLNLQGFS